ncbi:MAG: hypothetical protein UV66_C0007G0009 [Candidatus Woesebacteria bacterium GW2011_GWA1_43_12]|uniref:Shikimate kinase n=1 Tax=Candidatus Woesebacteria bacterium GW2011_GWA1_43_12 TaxID=1618557 RepID=A0A0G1CXS6_9BACT|nr:MAG: hypothetical protein UV66_C0007G0009 [Candidatus Woesebacteria bacterium GW2011_GWA1_43_12]
MSKSPFFFDPSVAYHPNYQIFWSLLCYYLSMNFVFIYGPPAVGKLTVAKELSKMIGYKLFHNHLTVDLVTSIFLFDSDQLRRLSEKFRLEIFEEAAKANIEGLVFTMVYGPEADDEFIKKVVNIVEGNDGKVLFVRLFADIQILKKRVTEESRRSFNKTTSPQVLEEVIDKFKVFEAVSNHKSLSLDTGLLTPVESAREIINHYHLI